MISPLRIPQTDLDEILSVDPWLWEKLRGARLFLTGGSGFFGGWLLESLLQANERLKLNLTVVALSRDTTVFAQKVLHLTENKALHFLKGDVRDFTFPNGKFTHILHLAATSNAEIQAADPLGLFSIIVDGTKRVLEFARQTGVKRFLYVSSGAVYGQQPPQMTKIPEDYQGAPDPLIPQSVYGTAKRAAEQLCSLYNSVGLLEIAIARAFAFIGPGMSLDGHFAAGNFIRDGISGGPIKVNGDGTPLRSYLYAADLAWWLWKILLNGTPGRAYNVGSDEIVTIRKLAETVAGCFSPCRSVVIRDRPDNDKNIEQYVPDISLAVRELGLSVRLPIEEALHRTITGHSSINADDHMR
jgi:dTDP-glucose 4,6-dehydratase